MRTTGLAVAVLSIVGLTMGLPLSSLAKTDTDILKDRAEIEREANTWREQKKLKKADQAPPTAKRTPPNDKNLSDTSPQENEDQQNSTKTTRTSPDW